MPQGEEGEGKSGLRCMDTCIGSLPYVSGGGSIALGSVSISHLLCIEGEIHG